jgi:hypothetical protein
VFFSDGRSLPVSSIRWVPDGLRALTAEDIVSARFIDLAEVHLPKADPMSAVLADAMVPVAGTTAQRIVRMETTEGAVLTFPLGVLETRREGQRHANDFYHVAQPLWALTPFRVPEGSVCLRSFRLPGEVPLSLLPAQALAERSFTGFAWPWQRNRSIRGEVLRCGSYLCDLGISTHSYSELAVQLPPGAKTFSCLVGLDRVVGPGGCVRCAIHRDSPTGQPLWQSGLIVGAKDPLRVGPLDVRGVQRLVFVTDFAHDERPEGADPGDIRDEVDWLLPLVTVDPAALALTARGLAEYFPALADWSVSDKDIAGMKVSLVGRSSRQWEVAMDVDAGKDLTFTRKVRVSAQSGVLDIYAARGDDEGSQEIQVLANGQRLQGLEELGGPLSTAKLSAAASTGQRWSLMAFLGREVTLTIRAKAESGKPHGRMLWRGVGFRPVVEDLPADGKMLTPQVPLSDLEPTTVIWFPQPERKKQPTQLPTPGPRTVHGLALASAYDVTAGMGMTYNLDPAFRRFVAVVGSENPYHRGPFLVLLDGKEAWRSGEAVDHGLLQQAIVKIPPGTRTIALMTQHDMTTGVWAQAGFMRE